MKASLETKTSHYCRNFWLVFMLVFVAYIGDGLAQTDGGAAKVGPQTTTSERDGQHDFDFALGTWKAHLRRLEHPLTGSKTWVDREGLLQRATLAVQQAVRLRSCFGVFRPLLPG
jgi:hypothetical protein